MVLGVECLAGFAGERDLDASFVFSQCEKRGWRVNGLTVAAELRAQVPDKRREDRRNGVRLI